VGDVGVRVILVSLVILGCDSSSAAPPPPLRAPDDAIPIAVEVAGVQAEMGFALERLRWHTTVEPFSITKHPITWRQYDQCVSAGACDGSIIKTHACKSLDGSMPAGVEPDSPRVCVSSDQAARYCAWVGGALPAPEQWFLAARGQAPARYPWGEAALSCERHWLAAVRPRSTLCEGDLGTPVVGRHPAGASPSGIEDVLSVWAEYVGASSSGRWAACSAGNNCVVASATPGSIDRIRNAVPRQPSDQDYSVPAAFRCAWSGGAS
jgi:hypothetical protein